MTDIALRAHPSTGMDAASAIRSLRVRAARTAGRLDLLFALEGELARLRLPSPRAPTRADDLWRSTCFEAFVMAAAPSYCELNVTPAHAWALYRFDGYRHPAGVMAVEPAPNIVSSRRHDAYELHVTAELGPVSDASSRWRLALTAIIEDAAGRLSYWSVRHAPGKPDFHHRDALAVELTA